jgi:hypothetical protein
MAGLIIHIIENGKTRGYFGYWRENGAPHLYPFAHSARIFSERAMAERHAKWVEIMGRRTSQMGIDAKAIIIEQEDE